MLLCGTDALAFNGKVYETVLLRQSYREDGKVKNRTIANLTHCTPNEIAAIELALKHKDDLTGLASLQESLRLRDGKSIGAVWVLYQVAKRLGVEKALGSDHQGKLALWQVMARLIEQGSRLSAVGLAGVRIFLQEKFGECKKKLGDEFHSHGSRSG